jgi:Fur family ferric uptake transcriptional regulator
VDHDSLKVKLNTYLSRHGLKSTKQRDAIIDTFFEMSPRHVTIEDILQASRKTQKSISYATVYRTLMLLVEAGIANQHNFNEADAIDAQSLFELNTDEHHDHLICNDCGRIVEFENDTIEQLQHDVASANGFQIASHKMEIYGKCEALKATGSCPHKDERDNA